MELSECRIIPTAYDRVIYPSLTQGMVTADLVPVMLPDGRLVFGYHNEVDNLWIIKSRLNDATGQWEFLDAHHH